MIRKFARLWVRFFLIAIVAWAIVILFVILAPA